MLQQAHVPFGVVTRRQLDELDRYPVVVLPNVLRMDATEAGAFREYVRRGGRLYASRYTSLVDTSGVVHGDFALADVFGVHLEAEESGRVVYARSATEQIRTWLDPQTYVTHHASGDALHGGLLRLRADPDSTVLATLSLPYGHPDSGDVLHQNWASIHTSPPWEDRDEPTVVVAPFGSGRVVYSSIDIERDECDANARLFVGLVSDLLGTDWSVRCETHPAVSVSAFDERDSVRVCLLNSPRMAVPATSLRLRSPAGSGFVGLERVPSGEPVAYEIDGDGILVCALPDVQELEMLRARYERR
jgi:hypothetical protein